MEFTLMYTESPNNMLVKEYDIIDGFSGTMRASISALRPVIDVEISNTLGIMQANYAYIQEFGKFYFIRNKTNVLNDLWRFELEEDVLMTYQSDILNTNGVVERQKDNYDMYLPDQKIPVDCRKAVSYRKFSGNTPFNLTSITMMVLGGDS